MVQAIFTSFSLVSLIAFVSCALNQEIHSASEADKFSERFFDKTSNQKQNQNHLLEPVTSLSMSPDLLTNIPAGSLPGYVFQVFYDDEECKGPSFSGFSVKLNICSSNNEGYFFVTSTLTETIVSYFSDSLCTIPGPNGVQVVPFQNGCNRGFTNRVYPTYVFPTQVPHVAIR